MMLNTFYSLELEQQILGALLRNNAPLAEIELLPDDFFAPAHAELYEKIKGMYFEHGQIVWADLTLWALDKTFREEGDGLTYPRDLYDSCIVSIDSVIKSQAEMLRELSRKRDAWEAAEILKRDLETQTTSQAISDFVRSLEGYEKSNKVKSALEVREDIVKSLDMPLERNRTGVRCLDDGMAGGLYQGFTYGLCGAEKSGKTTLAHTISYNLAKDGTAHLYVAMEMGSFQIEQKNVAREKGFNSLKFLESRQEAKNHIRGFGVMDNLYYLDAPSFTYTEIMHHVSMTIAKHGIKGFIIDYWQLVQGQERGESEEKHLRKTAQAFADFARKNKVWCILLAQMNSEGKLFGGNGLRKACDQLYMIEQCEGNKLGRWLRMDASRYTLRGDLGTEIAPALILDNHGPHFRSL